MQPNSLQGFLQQEWPQSHACYNQVMDHSNLSVMYYNKDTASSFTATIMYPIFVQNIRESSVSMNMSINAKKRSFTQEADLPRFSKTWFDEKQIHKTFGFFHMKDKYCIAKCR